MRTAFPCRSASQVSRGDGPDLRCAEDLPWSITGAAAAVAWADGHVHPAERHTPLSYLQPCGWWDWPDALGEWMFEWHVGAFATAPAATWSALTVDLARFSRTPWAWIILRTAEHVASADGVVHPSELEAIGTIRTALQLPPGIPERYPALVAQARF